MGKGSFSIQDCIAAVRKVVPQGPDPVPLHAPEFAGLEWKYLKECLDTGWVSSVGKFVDRFERMLEAYTGVGRAVATANGTAALHICLKLAGVRAGDEVLSPALTFVATANAIAYCDAIPHLVDSNETTLGVDPVKLRQYLREIALPRDGGCVNRHTGRRLGALVVMHTFGYPVELEALLAVAEEYRLPLIEDAAESMGSFYQGRHTGNWGRLSALSFNGNKIITTGGGGAILTHDAELGRLAKHLTTTAKVPHPWDFEHDAVGYNYRLPNVNAALGCAQLEQLPGFIERKRRLAERYREAFAGISGAKFFWEPAFARSNFWLNTLILDHGNEPLLEPLLAASNEASLMTRPAWRLMHQLPMYRDCPRMDLSTAESLARRIINLPSSARLARVPAPR